METKSGIVKNINSKEELQKSIEKGNPVILHFWANWCDASKHMDLVFSHLSTDFPNSLFFRVEAEEQLEISETYSVSAVPYFVFFKDGKQFDTLEGADPSSLANKVAKIAGSDISNEPAAPASLGLAAGSTILEAVQNLTQTNSSTQNDLNQELKQLIYSHPIMLFMKGNPEEPKCGFSSEVIDILKKENVKFGSFDILTNQKVKDGLNKFSNWPTYPQLYVQGELLGGCDIITDMHKNDQLKEVFKEHGIEKIDSSGINNSGSKNGDVTKSTGLSMALTNRLAGIIGSSPVMLFMKGKPDEPKCGFSRKVVEILQQEKVPFKSFDILTDDEVRQGLKVYSNWSSYPQLYINKELIGGSDIVLEMQKSGELNRVLTENGVIPEELSLNDRIKKLINSSLVMLFMKGNPDTPRCGFSSKVVNALKEDGVEFGHFDILSDQEVREGLKKYSNWPTYPQLYYKGELVGGCDIVLELKESGELKSTLSLVNPVC